MANFNVLAEKSCQPRPKVNDNSSKSSKSENISDNSITSTISIKSFPLPGKIDRKSFEERARNDSNIQYAGAEARRIDDSVEGGDGHQGWTIIQFLAGANPEFIQNERKGIATTIGQKNIFDSEASEAAPPSSWRFDIEQCSSLAKGQDFIEKPFDKSGKGEGQGGEPWKWNTNQLPPNLINIGQQQKYRCGFEADVVEGGMPWFKWSSNAAYCYS